MSDKLLTYLDIADRWKCTERHVKTIKAAGDLLPVENMGRLVRFTLDEVTRFERGEPPVRKLRRKR